MFNKAVFNICVQGNHLIATERGVLEKQNKIHWIEEIIKDMNLKIKVKKKNQSFMYRVKNFASLKKETKSPQKSVTQNI